MKEQEKKEIKNINKRFSRFKRKVMKHIWVARLGLISIVGISIIFPTLIIINAFNASPAKKYILMVQDFLITPQDKLVSLNGRTNIVLLGKGGIGHDAPDLTDTIIVLSINREKNAITTISIPRDIWIPELKAKINSAYYWGNKNDPGSGVRLSKSIIEDVVGLDINYAVLIDFKGFKEVVNTIGPIDVNVESGFVDNRYPIAGKENDNCGGDPQYNCRYETIEFKQGLQKMNGDLALKFVRSRHATGDEGDDFARVSRQQLVLNSIKNKILSPETLLSPEKIKKLVTIGSQSIETDLPESSFPILGRVLYNSRNSIKQLVLDEKLLLTPPLTRQYLFQYVLVPKSGNWNEIRDWVKASLN